MIEAGVRLAIFNHCLSQFKTCSEVGVKNLLVWERWVASFFQAEVSAAGKMSKLLNEQDQLFHQNLIIECILKRVGREPRFL